MFRFGETVLDVIEKTSKIDMYQNKTEKYSALTPDIRIHYQTVFKYAFINIYAKKDKKKRLNQLLLSNQHVVILIYILHLKGVFVILFILCV